MKNKILIIGSDTEGSFKYLSPMYSGKDDIIVGNGKGVFCYKDSIFENLKGKIDPSTKIDINAHGMVKDSKHYLVMMKNQLILTSEIIQEIVKLANNQEVHISLHSCYSGTTINLIENLPLNSTLITYSDPNDVTSTQLGDSIFGRSLATYDYLSVYFNDNFIHYANFYINMAQNIFTGHCKFAVKKEQSNIINFKSNPFISPILPYNDFMIKQLETNLIFKLKEFENFRNFSIAKTEELQKVISISDFLYYLNVIFYNAFSLEDKKFETFFIENFKIISKVPDLLIQNVGDLNILGIVTSFNKLLSMKIIFSTLNEFLSNGSINFDQYNLSLIPAIHQAVQRGDISALNILTENKFLDINFYNNITGSTALIESIFSVNTFNYILEKSSDVNKAHALTRDTPLTIAIKDRNSVVVESLLKHGANINNTDLLQSPFFIAFVSDYIIGNDTIKILLLNHNVDVELAASDAQNINDKSLISLIYDLMLNYAYINFSKFRYIEEVFDEIKTLSIADSIAFYSLPTDLHIFSENISQNLSMQYIDKLLIGDSLLDI